MWTESLIRLCVNSASFSERGFLRGAVSLCEQAASGGINLPVSMIDEGWNFNSGNYLFTTDTK